MKIEKLAFNKIKVTVTPGELTVWNINPRAISPDSPQLKEFIASLIEQSYEGTSADLLNSNILVEACPQGDDFVFVITNVSRDFDNIQKEIARSVKKQKFLAGQYKVKAAPENLCSYFRFGTLAVFSQMLAAAGYTLFVGTKLYQSTDAFYLQVDRKCAEFKRICAVLSEYADSATHEASFGAYIDEHAKVFATYEDFEAISRLA